MRLAAYRDSTRLGKVDGRDLAAAFALENQFGSIARSLKSFELATCLKVVESRPLPEAGAEVLESLFIGLGIGFTLQDDFIAGKRKRACLSTHTLERFLKLDVSK